MPADVCAYASVCQLQQHDLLGKGHQMEEGEKRGRGRQGDVYSCARCPSHAQTPCNHLLISPLLYAAQVRLQPLQSRLGLRCDKGSRQEQLADRIQPGIDVDSGSQHNRHTPRTGEAGRTVAAAPSAAGEAARCAVLLLGQLQLPQACCMRW